MTTYGHFDSRNGFSDLENHTLDTKQTFLAASYPKLDTLTKFRSKPIKIWSKFPTLLPDVGFCSKVPQKKAMAMLIKIS